MTVKRENSAFPNASDGEVVGVVLQKLNNGIEEQRDTATSKIGKNLSSLDDLNKVALVSYFKEEKTEWKMFDEKPVLAMMNNLIRQNKIEKTPTCVIRYGIAGESKYVGDEEIWNGLMQLKETLKPGKQ